jgi:hypothetical protein
MKEGNVKNDWSKKMMKKGSKDEAVEKKIRKG